MNHRHTDLGIYLLVAWSNPSTRPSRTAGLHDCTRLGFGDHPAGTHSFRLLRQAAVDDLATVRAVACLLAVAILADAPAWLFQFQDHDVALVPRDTMLHAGDPVLAGNAVAGLQRTGRLC